MLFKKRKKEKIKHQICTYLQEVDFAQGKEYF